MKATRESAAAAVNERRVRHRQRGLALRVAVALFATVLLVVSIPVFVVLPEVGLPVLLWALGLLALEFDWAATAYSWVTWRWQQFHGWFGRQHVVTKAVIVAATLLVAVGLLGLFFLH